MRYIKRGSGEARFERPEGMPEGLYKLLTARGISSVAEARAFLRPDASMLNDARLLPGVNEAEGILRAAVNNGKHICVYGDYDVDGVCASSIMALTLTRMGANIEVYLPSRHDEGYGLNENAVREIAQRNDVLLTVDCGITSVSLVALAKELGMVVIVTDHHRPGEELPDCTVINPLVGDYPEKYLCGAGVAFKLSEALLGRDSAMDFIDLAGLATVADIVTLTGENRVIVKLALDAMNRAPRTGLAALREAAGMGERPFSSGTLGFQIGPRLNASGRIGSARRAYDLLTTESKSKASEIAGELNAENSLRKQIEDEILSMALSKMKGFDFLKHRAIVIAGEGWNSGVIGLAASRLVEKYHYPTILISLSGETGVGSCRSIPGVDIHAALTAVSGHLVKFGGHAQAAGLTINSTEIGAFSDALDEWLSVNVDPFAYVSVAEYDLDARFIDLDVRFVKLTEAFAPTGMGNPAPVFRSGVKVADIRRMGRDNSHLSLRVTDGTNYMRAVAFREGHRADDLPKELDILYAPKINEFGGRSTVEIELRAMQPRDGAGILEEARVRETALLAPFLTQMLYNRPQSFGIVDEKKVRELLSAGPQGTLIIAGDVETAAPYADIDVYIGKYPDDPRLFNAVCVMPTGDLPRGYRNIVRAERPYWFDEMPDLDDLRKAYRALRKLLSRPCTNSSLETYAESLMQECPLSKINLMACVLILLNMGLVIDRGGFALEMPPVKKMNPEENEAFLTARALKEV